MDRLRPLSVWVLVAWTLVLWAGRLNLAWTVTDDSTGRKLLATVPVAIFVLFAVAVGASLLLARKRSDEGGEFAARANVLATALALWTIGYWGIRLPMILIAPHEAAFKAVHVVLAVLSWSAAAWALRTTIGQRHEAMTSR